MLSVLMYSIFNISLASKLKSLLANGDSIAKVSVEGCTFNKNVVIYWLFFFFFQCH